MNLGGYENINYEFSDCSKSILSASFDLEAILESF